MLLCCFSCDIMKKSTKSKEEIAGEESIVVETTRIGDTVHYELPNVIYKDTTIYHTNRQGTTIKTVYDQSGNLASIDCFASVIAEIRKENRVFQASFKDKAKEKEEKINTTFFLYMIVGIVAIVAFGFFLLYKSINKNANAVKSILDKIR